MRYQSCCAAVKSQQLPDVESLWYCIVCTNLEYVAGSTDCHVSKTLQPFLPHLICCSLVSSSALLVSPQPCTWQIYGINMKSGNVTFCMLYWFTVRMKVIIIQLYHWWGLLMPAQLIRSNALLPASSNVVRFSLVPRPFSPPVFDRLQHSMWRGNTWEIWSHVMTYGGQCPTVIIPILCRTVPGIVNN